MSLTLVNLWQTKEERIEKYHLARSLGCSMSWARKMRDWRLIKIERMFHLCFKKNKHGKAIYTPYAQFLLPGFTSPNHFTRDKSIEPL